MSDDAGEKKIIIDEDWKQQVEAEKEAFKKAKEQPQPQAQADQPEASQMPPASFLMLVTTLATEAMVALGQIPEPASGKPVFEPDQARYLIDMLEVLEQKTRGNLDPEENQALESVLHQLRLAFVTLTSKSGQG